MTEEKYRLFAVCDAALRFFEENALPGERLKSTIARLGCDEFARIIMQA
ncbi:MAG: hypothetical protein IJU48_00630 [Synergistaceae bacterium]|nr:hypothetical protein [Synergistaceae bacterium]